MRVGDIVKARRADDLVMRLGIIVRDLSPGPFDMDMFEVMACDGRVENYTSAALRSLDSESG